MGIGAITTCISDRPREVKRLAQGHTAGKQWHWNSDPSSLGPKTMLLIIQLGKKQIFIKSYCAQEDSTSSHLVLLPPFYR